MTWKDETALIITMHMIIIVKQSQKILGGLMVYSWIDQRSYKPQAIDV